MLTVDMFLVIWFLGGSGILFFLLQWVGNIDDRCETRLLLIGFGLKGFSIFPMLMVRISPFLASAKLGFEIHVISLIAA